MVDGNLQTLTGWQKHEGGNIGGVPPKLTLDQSLPPIAVFHIEGSTVPGGYADVDWYISRPIMANTGNLSLGYDLTVDANVAGNAQAIERDVVISKGGYNYNFSFQILVSNGWKLQISDVNGSWVDTGYAINPLAPGVVHRFVCFYAFNFTTKTYSYLAILIDGVFYPIPSKLQNLGAKQTGWADGAIFQFQQDLTAVAGEKGLGYSEELNNANLTWW